MLSGDSFSPNRRQLLRWLSGLAVISALPLRADELRPREPAPGALDELLAEISRQDAVTTVGRAYLGVHPEEADIQTLVRRIQHRLAGRQGSSAQISYDRLGRSVHDAITDDFEEGHLVEIQGWLLSETEVRLLAAAALYAGGAH